MEIIFRPWGIVLSPFRLFSEIGDIFGRQFSSISTAAGFFHSYRMHVCHYTDHRSGLLLHDPWRYCTTSFKGFLRVRVVYNDSLLLIFMPTGSHHLHQVRHKSCIHHHCSGQLKRLYFKLCSFLQASRVTLLSSLL